MHRYSDVFYSHLEKLAIYKLQISWFPHAKPSSEPHPLFDRLSLNLVARFCGLCHDVCTQSETTLTRAYTKRWNWANNSTKNAFNVSQSHIMESSCGQYSFVTLFQRWVDCPKCLLTFGYYSVITLKKSHDHPCSIVNCEKLYDQTT